MTDSSAKKNEAILSFEGKRYDLNTLPDEIKELVRGMQVADAQLRMQEDTLKVLADAKSITDNFFDNVIVNDENSYIKKNRLELLQMFCKTYDNFIDFSKVEGV